MTGVPGPICPECGLPAIVPGQPAPSWAWSVGAIGLYFSILVTAGAMVLLDSGSVLQVLAAIALAGALAGMAIWCTRLRRHSMLMQDGYEWGLAAACWMLPPAALVLLVGRALAEIG